MQSGLHCSLVRQRSVTPNVAMQAASLTISRDATQGADHERLVAHARNDLGPAAFGAAWTTGIEMTLQQAVVYALKLE